MKKIITIYMMLLGVLFAGNVNAVVSVATDDGSGIQCQTLWAGQTLEAGTVCVEVIDADVVITYTTLAGWELVEAHVWMGDSQSGYPQTRQGNPKIGNFPYKSGDITGATTYTVSVPLEVLEFSCSGDPNNPTADKEFFIAAHAALQKPDGSGGYQTETGWADGDTFVERGMWGTYFGITLTCNPPDFTPPQVTCETAFAYGDINLYANDFLKIDEDADGTDDFNRWGWSNGPLGVGDYTFDIYAGAGQSDLTKGTLVGELSVSYSNGVATVTYDLYTGFWLDETQLYVGNEILPRDTGDFTVAPGQYGNVHDGLSDNGVLPATDTFTIEGLSGDIYVVAHANVCGYYTN